MRYKYYQDVTRIAFDHRIRLSERNGICIKLLGKAAKAIDQANNELHPKLKAGLLRITKRSQIQVAEQKLLDIEGLLKGARREELYSLIELARRNLK